MGKFPNRVRRDRRDLPGENGTVTTGLGCRRCSMRAWRSQRRWDCDIVEGAPGSGSVTGPPISNGFVRVYAGGTGAILWTKNVATPNSFG